MGPLEVVDLDLDAARPGVLEAADELDADCAAVLFELQPAHDLAAHQPEVAVDVADRQPEQEPHRGRVDRPDHAAVQRVGAVALVALDPIHVRGHVLGELRDLGRVVLAIAVGVENPVAAGFGQGRAQRTAVAAVCRVPDHPQPRLSRCDVHEPRPRVVARAIVDDDDFAHDADLVQGLRCALDEAPDRLGVVVTQQARRDRALYAQARAAQTRSTSESLSSG